MQVRVDLLRGGSRISGQGVHMYKGVGRGQKYLDIALVLQDE